MCCRYGRMVVGSRRHREVRPQPSHLILHLLALCPGEMGVNLHDGFRGNSHLILHLLALCEAGNRVSKEQGARAVYDSPASPQVDRREVRPLLCTQRGGARVQMRGAAGTRDAVGTLPG